MATKAVPRGFDFTELEPPPSKIFPTRKKSSRSALNQIFDAFCKDYLSPSSPPPRKYIPPNKNPGYTLCDKISENVILTDAHSEQQWLCTDDSLKHRHTGIQQF